MALNRFLIPQSMMAAQEETDLKVGDRVRNRTHTHWVGTVRSIPAGPVIHLGGHTIGNEVGVELDAPMGGMGVAPVNDWEKI